MNLKETASSLPKQPGVYLFHDKAGHIIYVGKSKNLRSRVSQYFNKSGKRWEKVEEMVKNIDSLEYRLTDTELEALLLECELIKAIKPIYNSQMKNFGKYRYIELTTGETFPRLKIALDRDNTSSMYFGPFASRSLVESTITLLEDAFPIRRCAVSKGRDSGCLNYHLGNCSGPCCKNVSEADYDAYVQQVISFFEGKESQIIDAMESQMAVAAANMAFEKAARYRDMLSGANNILHRMKVIRSTMLDISILAAELVSSKSVKLFFIRHNKLVHSEMIEFEDLNRVKLSGLLNKYGKNEIHGSVSADITPDKDSIDEIQIVYSYLKKKHSHLGYVELEHFHDADIIVEKVMKMIEDLDSV